MKKIKHIMILTLFTLAIAYGNVEAWQGKAQWTFKADGAISGVSIAGNTVIVGDDTGRLHAVQKSSGQEIWSYKGTNSIIGTPSLLAGQVVFAQADGTVTCLKLSDGSVVWQRLPSENDYETETVSDGTAVGDGKVFFATGSGKLHALNASDGKLVWTYQSEQPDLRSAPAFSNGFVLLGEQNGRFSIIDPKTGKRLSGGGAGGPINTPVVNNGNVFFSSWDGSVHSVRLKAVVPQWQVNVNDPVTTSPSIGGGRVFVGTARGYIVAIDENSGKILWKFNTEGGNVLADPVATGKLVFACDGQGVVSILDAATGELQSVFKTQQGIGTTPAFEDGVFYLGSIEGTLYTFSSVD